MMKKAQIFQFFFISTPGQKLVVFQVLAFSSSLFRPFTLLRNIITSILSVLLYFDTNIILLWPPQKPFSSSLFRQTFECNFLYSNKLSVLLYFDWYQNKVHGRSMSFSSSLFRRKRTANINYKYAFQFFFISTRVEYNPEDMINFQFFFISTGVPHSRHRTTFLSVLLYFDLLLLQMVLVSYFFQFFFISTELKLRMR